MKQQWLFFNELKNTSLRYSSDSKAGTIEDVALDLDTGQVVFYAAGSGGFLGMGEDRMALPPNTIHFQEEEARLDVPHDRVRNAPGSGDHWPERIDAQFVDALHRHYGYRPATPR